MKNFKGKFLDQKGQAIFEMILFLPFLLFLYTIYYTAGNAISGSINQQKAVRGYFYTLVKGNSYINNFNELRSLKDKNVKKVGFNAIGWNERIDSGPSSNSYAPCFKFSSLLKNNSTEECEGSEREEEGSSRFIRLFTFYGVCGPADVFDGKDYFDADPRNQGLPGY
ncbi:MAG: hypothetical protein ACXVCE_07220, partial [Bacteriovorax sp.]